jgi:hypothetical protein
LRRLTPCGWIFGGVPHGILAWHWLLFHEPLDRQSSGTEQLMASQIDMLMEKLQQVQAEIEVELAKRRKRCVITSIIAASCSRRRCRGS